MTTLLADTRFGVMVSDSNITDGDRAWSGRKVRRMKGSIVGFAGNVIDFDAFIWWFKSDMVHSLQIKNEDTSILVLNHTGLFLFDDNSKQLQRCSKAYESCGTGGKAAMAAYEALGFTDPKRAVAIACKHDAQSRAPVRVYALSKGT